jgi:hypothetical protein
VQKGAQTAVSGQSETPIVALGTMDSPAEWCLISEEQSQLVEILAARRGKSSVILPLRRYASLILGLELAWLMGVFGCNPKGCTNAQVSSQSYNCKSQLCTAAVNFWSGVPTAAGSFPPSILGYQTSILVPASQNQILGGDGVIRNSITLMASNTDAFVEAGYLVQGVNLLAGGCGAAGWQYFWTDVTSTGGIVMHCLGPVPQADLGNYANVRIANLSNTGSSQTFSVSIMNQATNFAPCTSARPCNESLWAPGGLFASVQLGMTLQGTGGALANSMLFFNNSYQDSMGHFHLQVSDGRVSVGNPPLAGWTNWPSQPNVTDGGDFYTWCCVIPTVFPDLYFGTLQVGTASQAQTVTVTNTGSTGMSITGFSITGAHQADFQTAGSGLA